MSRAALSRALAALLLAGCGESDPKVELCESRIQVRLAEPSPLQIADETADLLQVGIDSDDVLVFNRELTLPTKAGVEGTLIDVLNDATDNFPEIQQSDSLRVTLGAVASNLGNVLAVGRTPRFGCTGREEPTVSLFLGPANDFAKTAGDPTVSRLAATASPLGNGIVLIVGGETSDGQAAVPAAAIYDHGTGEFCSFGESCLDGELNPRIEHTATVLKDGTVLITGGRAPGTSTLLRDVVLFDPVTRVFRPLVVGAEMVPRARHVAVQLDGSRVSPDLEDTVLVVGGCGASCLATDALSGGVIIDVEAETARSLAASMTTARVDAAGTLLPSGEVLISGGRDPSGQLLNSFEIFDAWTETFTGTGPPCEGTDSGSLCAKRASHTSTSLDDGNVLLWGGDVEKVAGVGPPLAEVVLLSTLRSHPVDMGEALNQQDWVGHTATRVSCGRPPCPVLVVGGHDPSASNQALPTILFHVAQERPNLASASYGGTFIVFAREASLAQRSRHAAAGLEDGTVFLSGGRDPALGTAVMTAASFSYCQSAERYQCPAP